MTTSPPRAPCCNPKISGTNPNVKVTNPAQSIPPVKDSSRDSSTTTRVRKNTTTPIGTFKKKNHRHDASWVSNPATIGPTAEPTSPTPDHMPRALARSSGGNALFTIDSDVVKITPAPRPWTRRAAIRKMSLVANPQAIDPPTNSTMPHNATFRRPTMSARRPTATIGDTNARRYALTAHANVSVDALRSLPIWGSATVSPKKSSVNRIMIPDIATTTHQRRFSSVTAGLIGREDYGCRPRRGDDDTAGPAATGPPGTTLVGS